MLVQLAIRDIVLIDRLDLDFRDGLTVLTGETGAGKSILLDAFALALGGRGDGSLVREGEKQGQVTAVFNLAQNHPARAAAAAQDLDIDGDLLLRRVQMADGRTRAFLNDQPLSAQSLRAIAASIVEIHGQHDERALVDPVAHRALLDAFGGLSGQAETVRTAFRAWRAVEAGHAQEQAKVDKARAEADFLQHSHAELSKLAAQPGEEAQLAAARSTMMQAEKVTADIKDAHEAISGHGSPMAALSGVLRKLERRQAQAPALIEPSVQALDEALIALDQAQRVIEQALRDSDFDPHELERTEERLFAMRGAARKFGASVDNLPALAEKFAGQLAALDAGEARLKALWLEVGTRKRAFDTAAAALSAARLVEAAHLDSAVNAELAPLKLERARFITQIDTDAAQPSADGIDRVEFWVATNPGTRPGPLMKVASGGELARFMLALKVALADRGSAPTLVFDEIDSGVGGAVADAIGQRLARLAQRVQVLAVTHAPQVAARARGHFKIAKGALAGADSVVTRVARLDAAARREEIARMLSGAEITAEARAAAGRLLEGAV